jgi:hypothetical protein
MSEAQIDSFSEIFIKERHHRAESGNSHRDRGAVEKLVEA